MKTGTAPGAAPPLADLQYIDAACDQFEAAWRAGRRPELASYLADAPARIRAPLLRDLLGLDLEYRRRRGEFPDVRSYQE
jgi:hypothetical protein